MLPALQSVEELSEVLERALKWEADRPISWTSCGGSLLVHMLVFLPWLPAGQPASLPKQSFLPVIFQPAPGQAARIPQHISARPNPALITEPGFSPEQVRVDLRTIRLSFADDSRHEVPRMVEAQHGILALLDGHDRSMARYLLEPPGWRARASLRDVSAYTGVLMSPPENWQVFRDAAQRDGIDLGHFQACALFEASFMICVKKAILARAATDPKRSGNVVSARLGISPDQPCGIEVLEVSFASN